MEQIEIFHAFNGFLYSPIFLADKLGFFPKNTKLVYKKGDQKTIEALCSHEGSEDRFAICDPFSIDLNKAMEHTDDDICVVASLINVIPLWVYNPDRTITPVRNEENLIQYKDKISKIVTYPKGTTGYLIAERVRNKIGISLPNVIEKEFGAEFDDEVQDNIAIVTADVLRMSHYGLDDGNLIFNYSTKSPSELKPFLFTGILTRRSTVNSNLSSVLSILGAIRTAIERLSERNVDARYIEALTGIYSLEEYGNVFSKLSITEQANKTALVRKAVTYLFRTENIYAGYPKPSASQWVSAWNNARAEWKRQNFKDYPSIEEKEEPIPALLVKANWKPTIAEYFRDFLYPAAGASKKLPAQSMEFVKRQEKLVLLVCFVISMASFLATIRAAKYTFATILPAAKSPIEQHFSPWSFGAISTFFVMQVLFYLWIYSSVVRLKRYDIPLIFWGVAAGIFATLVFDVIKI